MYLWSISMTWKAFCEYSWLFGSAAAVSAHGKKKKNSALMRKMYWGAEVNHLLCHLRHMDLLKTGPKETVLVHCNLKQLTVMKHFVHDKLFQVDIYSQRNSWLAV